MRGPIRHFWYHEAWKRVVPDREVVTHMNMYSDLLSEELYMYPNAPRLTNLQYPEINF